MIWLAARGVRETKTKMTKMTDDKDKQYNSTVYCFGMRLLTLYRLLKPTRKTLQTIELPVRASQTRQQPSLQDAMTRSGELLP